MSQSVCILGSTGSVGKSTLDVIDIHPELFDVVALTASSNVDLMFAQIQKHQPSVVVMAEETAAQELRSRLTTAGMGHIEVIHGETNLCDVAANSADIVMAAIVGAAGLKPTLAAVKAGKRVLIANKEPLVMTGEMFMQEAKSSGATILPIDSEHNAIFQCLPEDQSKRGVKRVHLTASGGPFLGRNWSDLEDVSADQACAHPNWTMGRKISVDSATMFNKGLELIEATALFGLSESLVNIVVHPQSIIHSMVEYVDGSFLAQLGSPDMKIPIAYGLTWPKRIASGAETLDITQIARLDFQAPDYENTPCLKLAREAAAAGGTKPTVLNAANEIAVEAFLNEKIRFTDIPRVIEHAMSKLKDGDPKDLDSVLIIDNEARAAAREAIDSL